MKQEIIERGHSIMGNWVFYTEKGTQKGKYKNRDMKNAKIEKSRNRKVGKY